MLAGELDELADATLNQLPLYQRATTYQNQGWYELESATVEPVHANRRDTWEYSLSLTFVGKRASSFRAVETKLWQPDHPWGNTMAALVGIPDSARKVRWLDREMESVAAASPVRTVAGDPLDISLYDVEAGEDALGTTNPVLVYDTEYAADVRSGVRVYDTRGYDAKYSHDGDGPRQWQIVHSTAHDIVNPVVFSNGVVRVRLDEAGSPQISAERWDADTGAWTAVDAVETAGSETDWTLYDIDVTGLGMQDVRAQLGFEHPTDGFYALNASLQPGRDAVLFWRPDSVDDPVPAGIEDWLDSIAGEWVLDPAGERNLVDRQEVRQ